MLLHDFFGTSYPTISMLLIVCKTSRHCYKTAFGEGVYLSMWTINISPLMFLYKALLNIISGMGAVAMTFVVCAEQT